MVRANIWRNMVRANIEKSKITLKYAQGILAVAAGEGMIEQVKEELAFIRGVLKENESMNQFLKNPEIIPLEKKDAVIAFFEGRVSEIILQQIGLVITERKEGLLLDIIDEIFQVEAESRKKNIAKFTTAIPVPKVLKTKLERVLSKLMGRVVFIKNSVDPTILGGFILKFNERFIDASIQGQLGRLKKEISKEIPLSPQKRSPIYLENAGAG